MKTKTFYLIYLILIILFSIFIITIYLASSGLITKWLMGVEAKYFDNNSFIQRNMEVNKQVVSSSVGIEVGEVEDASASNPDTEDRRQASSLIIAEVSAYTSSVNETDDTPCENAWGWNICNLHKAGLRMVACPVKYEPDSLVEIDGIIYACMDRMNQEKHPNDFDIYMGQGEEAYDRAMEWGRRTVEIKIYK